MNHKVHGRKLGRTSAHREALLSNLATALLRHGRIRTTLPKSKELREVVEKLITKAKSDTVHARRQVARIVRDKSIVRKLFQEIVPEFQDRTGGYTQIYRLGTRSSDGAAMAYIQLLGYVPPVEAEE